MNVKDNFENLPHKQNDTLPGLMLTRLTSWSAITMTGADKKSYLQGQVTCNVATLEQDQSTFGAHCDPKGKVWSVFQLFHHHDSYAMIQPVSAIEAELRELKKYAVFSKVEIVQSEDVLLGVMGCNADAFIGQLNGQETGNVRPVNGGTAVRISDSRWVLLLNETSAEKIISDFDGQKVNESIWQRFNIEDALPELSASEQNQHIPQAYNLHAIGGICFTKGCYTGQETVARAKYRGTNKRSMYIVSGDIKAPLTESMPEIERAVGENWRSAGHLMTSYTFSDQQAIGLIILPNNLEQDTKLRLASQPETEWSIQPLPYSLEDDE